MLVKLVQARLKKVLSHIILKAANLWKKEKSIELNSH